MMTKLGVLAFCCLALPAFAQTSNETQQGEAKMNSPSTDKTQSGTSKKKTAKKSKKAKKGEKVDHSKMDHSKMDAPGK